MSRTRTAVRCSVLLALAIAAAVPLSATAAVAPPPAGVVFGASVATTTGTSAAQALAGLEASVGRTLGIDRTYSRWDDVQPTPIVVDDVAHGRLPLLSIRPQRKDGSIIPWADLASGAHDAEIRAQADAFRDRGIALILTLHHEPELAVGYGTAADYVAAFRHYVAVFRGERATGVAFAVVLGAGTFKNPAAWYPGDDVVDWIGADAYNFAACVPGQPAWRSLATAAGPFYAWASSRGKPLVLAEWGSAEDPAQPGRKAQWLRDAATTLAGWPQVKAAAYFDRVGTCDWRITTSATAADAFADIAHSPWANGAPTARLVAATPLAAAPLAETFDLSTSTGAASATGSGVTSWSLDFGDGSGAVSGVGQPTSVVHTYAAGHWRATLTVRDAADTAATTTALVVAAPPPTISEGNATSVTSTAATLPAWIDTTGLAGSYRVEWGRTTAFGQRTSDTPLAAVDRTVAVTIGLGGLAPATRYYWRFVASSGAGTTTGPTRWFTTSP